MKLGVGVIGCGFISQNAHIPSIILNERAELLAVSDVKSNLAAKVASRWRVPAWYGDYEKLLENEDIQAVFVLTDKHSHFPIVMDALKAGKHVFVEKPLATRYSDAIKIAQEAKNRSLVTFVGYMKRYDAGMRLAREKILAGGQPLFARASYFGGNWTFGEPQIRPLSSDEKVSPPTKSYPDLPPSMIPLYDDLLEQIHLVNAVRYFFGEPRFISARYGGGFLLSQLDAGYPISVEFGSVNLGEWTEEYAAYYKNSRVAVRAPPPLYRNTTASVSVKGTESEVVYSRVGFKWAFEEEVDSFISAVLESKPYLSGADDSAKDLDLAEKIVLSAARARIIGLRSRKPYRLRNVGA
ncbi:MAG: Gfo/Idh/MocA family protein [Thermoprotei archaeon]